MSDIQTTIERRSTVTLTLDDAAQERFLSDPREFQAAVRQVRQSTNGTAMLAKRPYNRTAKPVAAKRSSGKMTKKTGGVSASNKEGDIICPVGGEHIKIRSGRHVVAHGKKLGWSKEQIDAAKVAFIIGDKA